MFTGIVQAIGTLKAMTKKGRGFEIIMEVNEDFDLKNKVELGDSVAHNGVCLTVTKISGNCYYADISAETSNDDELAPAEDKAHTEEEIAAINPQREEEEDFDAEDDSMEIVTDKKEIITTKSKTGQDLYYEVDVDGKKKRVSKEYALLHMDAQV